MGKEAPTKTPRVAILALPQALMSAVIGMVDAIQLANTFHALGGNAGPMIDVSVVAQGERDVAAFGGRSIPCDASLGDVGPVDAVVVAPIVSDVGSIAEENRATVDWLGEQWKRGTTLTAVCTGTVLLAETGVLDGRVATTNPGIVAAFDERYPKVQLDATLKLADEGRVVTAGATTSSFDLVVELIGRYLGPETAIRTAAELLTDPAPQSQKPYMLARVRRGHGDLEVQRVQTLIERDYATPLDPASLAREVAMSPRTLSRRFRAATGESVQEYLRNTRIEAAMRRLAASEEPVAAVTESCGYEDPRSFRRTFRELTGLSPREYRQRFSYARRAWAG